MPVSPNLSAHRGVHLNVPSLPKVVKIILLFNWQEMSLHESTRPTKPVVWPEAESDEDDCVVGCKTSY